MDFSLICSRIQELLIENERVLLPGVGEFTIESTPASFMEDGRTILPPTKKMFFRQGEFEGEFEQWQIEFGEKVKEQLQENGKFEVPGLGIFVLDSLGETSFTPNEAFDFAPDSFSLEAISLEVNEHTEEPAEPEELEELAEVEEPEEQEEEMELVMQVLPVQKEVKAPKSMEEKRKMQRWMVWTSVIVILILVMVLFVVLFKDDFMELVKRILYSKEELEIMQKWAAQ